MRHCRCVSIFVAEFNLDDITLQKYLHQNNFTLLSGSSKLNIKKYPLKLYNGLNYFNGPCIRLFLRTQSINDSNCAFVEDEIKIRFCC